MLILPNFIPTVGTFQNVLIFVLHPWIGFALLLFRFSPYPGLRFNAVVIAFTIVNSTILL